MRDLGRRTVTALVYGAVVLAAVVAPPAVFALLLGSAGALALQELVALRAAGAPAALEALVIAAGLSSLMLLRLAGSAHGAHGWDAAAPAWLLLALVPTWAADVAAYGVGSLVGRRKLAPRISPGKTWEGTLGGFAAAAIAALGVGALFGLPRGSVAVVAVLLGPVALAGDLLKSIVKRRVGVKDSGTLLPGHGGIVDRIDSIVAAAPLVLAALYLAGEMG